ncbi:hypothetical protein LCGC14_1959340, partial [marine sediment metagenome]
PQVSGVFKAPLSLLDAREFYAAYYPETQSFRLRETLPLDKFERTDFPQRGWLATVPEGLLDARDFYPAFHSLLQSFRSAGPDKLSLSLHLTQPQFSWLKVALDLDFDTTQVTSAAWQLSQSFRARESLPVDKFERTDFPQSTPFLKVPLTLLDAVDFFAAWYGETQAFRSSGREKLSRSQHLTQPQFSWLFAPLSLVDFDVSIVTSAAEQLFRSFRLRDRTLDKLERTDFPQLAPLFKEILGLRDFPEGVGAWIAQAQSFRSGEAPRLDLQRHLTQPEIAWLFDVLGLEDIIVGTDYRLFALRKSRR